MNSNELRPLGITELLRRNWNIFQTHFLSYLGIMAIPALASGIVAILVFVVVLQPSAGNVDPRETWDRMSTLQKIGILVAYLIWIASMIRACAATILATSEFYLGHPMSTVQAYRRIRRENLRLFWLLFVIGHFLLLVPVLFPLAVIAIAAYFAPVIPIILLENLKISKAEKRSRILSSGSYGRILLLFLLYGILVVVTISGYAYFFGEVQIPLGGDLWIRPSGVASLLTWGFLTQLYMIALTLSYYNQRMRREQTSK